MRWSRTLIPTLKEDPADAEVHEQFDGLFGQDSRLPECARKKYVFRPTAKPVAAEAATGRLSDARSAFETLTQQTPRDPAAWFNLGVVLAWLGEQPKAVEALTKSLDLETDDYRAHDGVTASISCRATTGHLVSGGTDGQLVYWTPVEAT